MNAITVKFDKQGEKYTRLVTFPDGKCVTEQDIQIKKQWHSPETWQWSKPLHEYSREELSKEGNHIAHVLLGQQGRDFLAALEPNTADNETNTQILILENTALPEIARIPLGNRLHRQRIYRHPTLYSHYPQTPTHRRTANQKEMAPARAA
ncbi:MAG: hypothetical protein NT166_31250 [Candidatus Aminicenantes bacterium]|nr:hypothetical protein [Candidatus Aminicenantes bacterium]